MQENREEQSRRFWTGMCDYLRQRGSQLESLAPIMSDDKHYRDFGIGIRGFAVRARQQVKRGRRNGRGLSAAFILSGRNQAAEFQSLQEQQAEIENDFGESLSWDALLKEKQVNTITMPADVTNETDWPNQYEWLAIKLEQLAKVFRDRIQELRAAANHRSGR